LLTEVSSDGSEVDGGVVGRDGVELDKAEDELVTRIAEKRPNETGLVVMVNSQSPVARSTSANRTSSVLRLQTRLVFTFGQSIGPLYVLLVGAGCPLLRQQQASLALGCH
jgi:hypothetical protein